MGGHTMTLTLIIISAISVLAMIVGFRAIWREGRD